MKTYQQVKITQIQAVQYGTDEKANEFVKLCQKDYEGKIRKVPSDLLGTPKDAFNAVKTASGWVAIQEGDWIVQKDSEVLVVNDSVFKLFFQEI